MIKYYLYRGLQQFGLGIGMDIVALLLISHFCEQLKIVPTVEMRVIGGFTVGFVNGILASIVLPYNYFEYVIKQKGKK